MVKVMLNLWLIVFVTIGWTREQQIEKLRLKFLHVTTFFDLTESFISTHASTYFIRILLEQSE